MLNQINKPFAIYSLSDINLGAKQARNTRGVTHFIEQLVGGGKEHEQDWHGGGCGPAAWRRLAPASAQSQRGRGS